MAGMRKLKKKAVFFTIDALIAAGILLIGLIIIPSFHINKQPTVHLSYLSDDLIGVLSELKVSELNSSYVNELIANGNITRVNNTAIEQIGEFWAEDNAEIAENFTMEVLGSTIPDVYGYSLLVNDEPIYTQQGGINYSLISSRKIISGYAKLQPVLGYTSKTYLTSIKDRKSSSFAYFGGFEGEGTLRKKVFLPQNITGITEIYMELVAGTDFNLSINGQYAGSYPRGGGGGSFIVPDRWDVNESYFSLIQPGENNFTIDFGYINENFTGEGPNYVGGGFIKVGYITNDTQEIGVEYFSQTKAGSRYYFPGIDEFINLYSAFYVPGNLTEMKVYLHINHSYKMLLRIGKTIVYMNTTSGEARINITNSELESKFAGRDVNYSDLSMVTLPLRLMLVNVSTHVTPFETVLVTDVSGSMDWRIDNDNTGTARDCDDPLLNDPSTKRLSGAKCAAKSFIDAILSHIGPMVGLVSYETDTDSVHDLDNNSASLKSDVDSYSASGSTCICCGVNSAVEMLTNDSQVMVLSRQEPGWKYDDSDLPSDPSGWTGIGFDDSGWSTGQAALGNGYSGLNTVISQYEGYYYFRKKFNMTNVSSITDSKLYVYSDDGADIYLNGNLVDNDIGSTHTADYWNRVVQINPSQLNEGENIIAAKLRNSRQCFWMWCWDTDVAFDMEIVANYDAPLDSVRKAMIIMSDGEANVECSEQGDSGDLDGDGNYDTARDDAIKAACDAYRDYKISVFTVSYGYDADKTTLQYMANCTDGAYYDSSNAEELEQMYLLIATYLIQFTKTQVANYSYVNHTLIYPDSYIYFNYTPEVVERQYGEIPITFEGNRFGNNISEGTFYLPEGNRLVSLASTSYSGDYWTDNATVISSHGRNRVYKLTKFGDFYHLLGDAFNVRIPTEYIDIGQNNTIQINTGLSRLEPMGGSSYNKLIAGIRMDSLLDYGGVFSTREGCEWFVKFEDSTNDTFAVPANYTGTKKCYYENATYDETDATDDAAYRLFRRLDFDNDGELEVRLDENNLEVDTLTVSDVPSLWGPALVEVRVW